MPSPAQGSRLYSWLSDEPLSYTSWQDGEPWQPGGCAYVDVDGAWRTASCDTKLQGAVCGVSGSESPSAGRPVGRVGGHPGRTPGQPCVCTPAGVSPPRRGSPHGSCPQDLADSAWIPFREHCYSFHLELLLDHKEALQRCQKGG